MEVIGIYDGHNTSVCLVRDGALIVAVEEERFSRIKFHDGRKNSLPVKSLETVLNYTAKEKIDKIAVALLPPLQLQKKVLKDIIKQKTFRWMFYFFGCWNRFGPLEYIAPFFYNLIRKRRILHFLKKNGLNKKPIEWIDHHKAHAASAYYTSGKENALICTLDAKGDALCGSVYVGKKGKLTIIKEISKYHSIAHLYSIITTAGLGFKKFYEGKVTGLAAYGNSNSDVYKIFKSMITFNDFEFDFKFMRKVFQPPYPSFRNRDYSWKKIKKLLPRNTKREDIAAAVQRFTEELVTKFISKSIEKTRISNLCLAGGLFANVKVNQRLLEQNNINSIYIVPPMSDAGLSIGVALYSWAEELDKKERKIKINRLKNVYFGPQYSNQDIKTELDKNNLKYTYFKNIELEIAKLLAKGFVVARFSGRMEFGPRALGNRSILYQTTDKTVNDWLNKKLKRTEFMPFAPATLKEYINKCYKNTKGAEYTAKFMTITFNCTDWMKKNCPGVVHVDGTARPQLLSNEDNPSFYKIIDEYRKLAGIPSVINTSFNIHEEPIVCSPADAVRAFKLGHLDYLAIGNYLVKNENKY